MADFSISKILLLLLVGLLLFGAKRLPEMGRALGLGMREFKDSVTGLSAGGDPTLDDVATPDEAPARPETQPLA